MFPNAPPIKKNILNIFSRTCQTRLTASQTAFFVIVYEAAPEISCG
jgi:hypothetical protein